MNGLEDDATRSSPPEAAGTSGGGDPGLPWFRTWRAVYLFVIGCFVFYVVFLAVLPRVFS